MKEHPILFSTPMIKAILAGQKTQTRRVIKLRKGDTIGNISENDKVLEWIICDKDGDEIPLEFACPYGSVGDRLWCKETFKYIDFCLLDLETVPKRIKVEYKADGIQEWVKCPIGKPNVIIPDNWRPSIFMPRWASRITLEITDVRVQKVQDISPEDTVAEGVTGMSYQPLWDSINGDKGYDAFAENGKTVFSHSWRANPYVWAISFKVVK